MPYVDSYIWKIRQKIGHDLLLMPATDTVAVDVNGKVLLIYNRDFKRWCFPGGYVEPDQTLRECAARELYEEGGLESSKEAMIPIASMSGETLQYPNGDSVQPFRNVFMTKQWHDSGHVNDSEEVLERRWFDVNELQNESLSVGTRAVLTAYLTYTETGEYQIVNLKDK